MLLAIDPGPKESGYAVLAVPNQAWNWKHPPPGGAVELRQLGVPSMSQHGVASRKFLEEMLDSWRWPVVVEDLASYGGRVGAETFHTAEQIGRIELLCERGGIQMHRLSRSEVKATLCGSARGTDADVRQALIDIYGPKGKKAAPGVLYGVNAHALAALAVALTWYVLCNRAKARSAIARAV